MCKCGLSEASVTMGPEDPELTDIGKGSLQLLEQDLPLRRRARSGL